MNTRLLVTCLLFLPSMAYNQRPDTSAGLHLVESFLRSSDDVEKALLRPDWMFLHPNVKFRDLIKNKSRKSEITLATASEPGRRIIVIVKITDSLGSPINGALVYCYQTDNRGFYAFDTTHVWGYEGDRRHARLFCYGKTDKNGKFVLHTIMPSGYPKSQLPAHIHCEISRLNQPAFVTELRFADDPRLTKDQKIRSQEEGFFVSKEMNNTYNYSIKLKDDY